MKFFIFLGLLIFANKPAFSTEVQYGLVCEGELTRHKDGKKFTASLRFLGPQEAIYASHDRERVFKFRRGFEFWFYGIASEQPWGRRINQDYDYRIGFRVKDMEDGQIEFSSSSIWYPRRRASGILNCQ